MFVRMDPWLRTSLVLCAYGFLKELRPSEPYLTEYLVNPMYANITSDEANYDVYPVWTYSYLSVLIVVFLLTDLLRYKIVLVIEGFAYVGTWLLLLYAKGVRWMQLMQVVYGIATSTEVAYYTYIYAKVEPEMYQKVTSYTRSALLFGRFASGILGQVLVATSTLDYRGLNYFSLISVCLSTGTAFLLPPVKETMYFHRNDDQSDGKVNFKRALGRIKSDFIYAFKQPYVLKWSIWWSMATCGNFQVGNYIQLLWKTIVPHGKDDEIYNGAVEAATTLTGAVLAFLLSFVRLNWSVAGGPVLAFISLLDGVILIIMAKTEHIWVAYVGYWAFRALYQMLITVASFEVASKINKDSYALVFGVNTFLALLFQTILTVVVVDDVGLGLDSRTQFIVYGGFWIFLGTIFAVTSVKTLFCSMSRGYTFRTTSESTEAVTGGAVDAGS